MHIRKARLQGKRESCCPLKNIWKLPYREDFLGGCNLREQIGRKNKLDYSLIRGTNNKELPYCDHVSKGRHSLHPFKASP